MIMGQTTKNAVLCKLQMIENLSHELEKLKKQLCEDLNRDYNEPFLSRTLQELNFTQAEKAYQTLEDAGYFKELDAGQPVLPAIISINEKMPHDVEVSLKLPDDGRLTAYTSYSDFQTAQAGTIYYDKENSPMDLSLTEQKRGELAMVCGKNADNQDLDIMVWDDPFNEDYQHKYTLNHGEMEQALTEMEEYEK